MKRSILRLALIGGAALAVAGCTTGSYGGYGYTGLSYGNASPYGWYDNYDYPGTGYYVYERSGARHRWSESQRRHWQSRGGNRGHRDNWSGYHDRGGDSRNEHRWSGRNHSDQGRHGSSSGHHRGRDGGHDRTSGGHRSGHGGGHDRSSAHRSGHDGGHDRGGSQHSGTNHDRSRHR